MNPKLQQLLDVIHQSLQLSDDDKSAMVKSIREVDKEIEITNFKLERTEKVKRTTGILLEETIEELEQKRKAVVAQNHELEIESALERVRAQALGLRKPEELTSICEVLFATLKSLGFNDLRNTMINIHDDAAESFLNYDFSLSSGKTVTNIFYNSHPVTENQVKQIRSSTDAFVQITISGHELDEWQAYRKGMGEEDDPYLSNISALFYYLYSIGTGSIGISTYHPVTEAKLTVLKRFRNVFDFAYCRYMDVAQAEAQAKEAQIELALERVRARTMAMRQSDELAKTASVLFQQIKELGFDMWSCGFCIWEKNDQVEAWMSADAGGLLHPMMIPYKEEPTHQKIYEASLLGNAGYETIWEGAELEKHYAFMQTIPSVKLAIDQLTSSGLSLPSRQCYYVGFFKRGYILLITNEPNNLASEISKRFANVFDQTYTRFLDLQKVEAQAKEAQIEAALERVRSRTMAMHNSTELIATAELLFDQINLLGAESLGVAFGICEPDNSLVKKWTNIGNFSIPYTVESGEEKMYEAWKNQTEMYEEIYEGKRIKDYYEIFMAFPAFSEGFQKILNKGYPLPVWQKNHAAIFKYGYLLFITTKPFEETNIFIRFAKVFEQTYTRFLDLQKAEAQTREAQIESALEKVRSRSLAMHHSGELNEVITEVLRKLEELGITMEKRSAIICLYKDGAKEFEQWVASPEHSSAHGVQTTYFDSEIHNDIWNARINGTDFYAKSYTAEEMNAMFQYFFAHTDLRLMPEKEKNWLLEQEYYELASAFEKHSAIMIANFTADLLDAGVHQILKRFVKVFEQAYIRFLDLQKAEAQAREAQIEAALERVRARTMAMHKSEQLTETAQVLFEQFAELGKIPDRISIGIIKEELQVIEWWATDQMGSQLARHFDTSTLEPAIAQYFAAWKEGKDSIIVDLSGEALKEWVAYVRDVVKMPIDDSKIKGRRVHHGANFSQGLLLISSHEPMANETMQLLVRFAKVFSQTYTRFLDLQKAEAQAREAQIESALERVRSRAMAMQNSDDVSAATGVMFQELHKLGIETIRCGILIIHENKTMEVWNSYADNEGEIRKVVGLLDMNIHPMLHQAFEAWRNKDENLQYKLEGEDMDAYYAAIAKSATYQIPDYKGLRDIHYCNFYFFEEGSIYTFTPLPHNTETHAVMKKFTTVFSLTFRRYQDLKNAEAQARDAQIQLALERVRARTMAMQRSEELGGTCELLFKEFHKLHVIKADIKGTVDRVTIGIFNEAEKKLELSITGLDGKRLGQTYPLSIDEPTNIAKAYAAWKNEDPLLVIDMRCNELNQWLDYLKTLGLPIKPDSYNKRRINYFAFFSKGALGMTTNELLPEESLQLLQRFADTFNLTYTRFQDLKDAEARTQIAVKEASLDRVRAEIASMRTAEDLQRITPLVWRELTALGVPFFRCGVFIVDDEKQKIHFYLSAPDGKPLAAFELDFDGAEVTKNATAHWREQKVYISHWSKEEFLQFAENLISQGQIQNVNTYQGGQEAPESLTLQFVPFAQGMMYVGSAQELSADQLDLVKSLADAFSTAYARYEDFTKLESAKQQIELTLKDLRATQTQLIQSEKMASLGELTAGIAHEIQNPLNFVNNFSEVSTELVDEMNEEMQKGNFDEAKEIANDLKENLVKINHHGKRAGDIVKGMLQHSRNSGDQKEPTDINALADEYLRLAYHGLRAKDKSFNATMKTDFDATIGDVNIIPQDIGRVILNLITNAFYVVDEKKKQTGEGYEPTVSVSTKKKGNKVFISVKDNGNGIPQQVLDKIFQPFFTTKPTGQGTGLGLSMSYDIVTKGHGGELSVTTEQGIYAEFSIVLPI